MKRLILFIFILQFFFICSVNADNDKADKPTIASDSLKIVTPETKVDSEKKDSKETHKKVNLDREELNKLVKAYNENPTPENLEALKKQIEIIYDKTLEGKKERLAKLEKEINELATNREININKKLDRYKKKQSKADSKKKDKKVQKKDDKKDSKKKDKKEEKVKDKKDENKNSKNDDKKEEKIKDKKDNNKDSKKEDKKEEKKKKKKDKKKEKKKEEKIKNKKDENKKKKKEDKKEEKLKDKKDDKKDDKKEDKKK